MASRFWKFLYACVAAVGVLSLTGCASVTGSPVQSVSVQARSQAGAEVKGAACELTNNKGRWYVTTPGSVSIHRSNDDMQVICSKEGMDPGRAAVVSDTKGSMFGNIILGGGIGALIDHNNGTAYEYPSFIQVLMGAFSKIEGLVNNTEPAPSGSAPQAGGAVPNALPPPAAGGPSVEDRLRELKRLYDGGLISQEVFIERQRRVLEQSP